MILGASVPVGSTIFQAASINAFLTTRLIRAKLIPDARAVTSVGQLVRWTTDPFAGGSWALWQPGQAGRHHNVIRAPIGKVAFAGEHTAEAYRGMEAAMESGERAALEVMRILA